MAGLSLAVAGVLVVDRVPATVAEQRQRLPAAAECDDPIAGVWRAHVYRPDIRRWTLNTMELRWSPDRSKLLSSYENHYWRGGPEDSEPPPCRPGEYQRKAHSTGEGSYSGNELEVRGTAGGLLLKGLKVRWGLGLRENLFVIDRESGDDGEIESFVITGKGWGHGVGLCQVGAFGMAQTGSSFEEILKHYYTGIRLALSSPAGTPPIS